MSLGDLAKEIFTLTSNVERLQKDADRLDDLARDHEGRIIALEAMEKRVMDLFDVKAKAMEERVDYHLKGMEERVASQMRELEGRVENVALKTVQEQNNKILVQVTEATTRMAVEREGAARERATLRRMIDQAKLPGPDSE